jgi:catechol 2,3-dioxygenase-like lactoylglutathione lyase family enzyme
MNGMTPHLAVYDMPTAVAFYRDVLGFTIVQPTDAGDDFPWGLLKCGAAEVMLNTAFDRGERPAQPDPTRHAAHEDVILYIACPDVDAAYAELRAKGVEVAPPEVAWYGMKQLYVKDPDGYLLCFQYPAR